MKNTLLITIYIVCILIEIPLIAQSEIIDTCQNGIILQTIDDKPWPFSEKSFVKISKDAGYNFFTDIDSGRYRNKSIGYIVEDLESTSTLIGWSFPLRKRSFWGLERISKREEFEIYLKNSDTTAIIISGFLKYKNYLPSDDEEAFEALLKQKKYRLTFYQVNIYKWYTKIREEIQQKDPYYQTILKGDKLYWEQNGLEIHEEYKVFKRAYPNIVKDE
ncbi:MAG: hypothetical protein ABFD07_00360 [Methanobacterium sp.]